MQQALYDISRSISPDAAVYPGDDPLGISDVCVIGPDAPCNITALSGWTTHFLTHVDAPKHFVVDGETLDRIDLGRFVLPATVVSVQGDQVLAEDVPDNLSGKAVLFRTRNSASDPTKFDENHVYVSAAAVEALIDRRASLVGIDYLSVDQYGDENYPAHNGLLGNNILILEGLNLADVPPGDSYTLIALPLKIAQADGSPVRAVLQA